MWNSDWNCVRALKGHPDTSVRLIVWNNLLFLADNEGTITVWKWTSKYHIAIDRSSFIHSFIVWKTPATASLPSN